MNIKEIEYEELESGCFECTSYGLKSNGSTMIQRNKKRVLIYRYVWEYVYGSIPKEMNICHKCDNRACINLSHLFMGTQADNVTDCVEKMRHAKGEDSGPAKLTNEQAKIIKYSTKSTNELAKEFNVTRHTIMRIRNGYTWRHI